MISRYPRPKYPEYPSRRYRKVARQDIFEGFMSERGCADCGSHDYEQLMLWSTPEGYHHDRFRRSFVALGRRLATAEVVCKDCFAKRKQAL